MLGIQTANEEIENYLKHICFQVLGTNISEEINNLIMQEKANITLINNKNRQIYVVENLQNKRKIKLEIKYKNGKKDIYQMKLIGEE